MPRKKKSKFRSDKLPVEAFSDIAFLLIIFFILVTSLTKHKGFLTDIPAGQKTEQKQDKIPSVNIKDNIVLFEGNAVSMDELRTKLKELNLGEKKDPQQKMVMLEATGQASYQNYFASMAAIDAAGGIVTIVKEDTSGGGK